MTSGWIWIHFVDCYCCYCNLVSNCCTAYHSGGTLMSFFWKCTVDLFWQNDISTVPHDLACSDLVQLLWFIVEKILVLFAVVFFLMSLSIWLVWCCPFFWTGIGIPINRWRPWFHRHISFPGEGFIVWHPQCNPFFFDV